MKSYSLANDSQHPSSGTCWPAIAPVNFRRQKQPVNSACPVHAFTSFTANTFERALKATPTSGPPVFPAVIISLNGLLRSLPC
jgi:hypothetical protein